MTDLYAILGVPRDATTEDIRKAYRAKAKTMHPDAGGDAAAFSDLLQAHDTLVDDEARQRYDTTGEYGMRDDVQAEAKQFLACSFAQVIERMLEFHIAGDVHADLRARCQSHSSGAAGKADDMKRRIAKMEDSVRRMKAKDKTKDPMAPLFNHMLQALKAGLARCEFQVKVGKAALAILDNYMWEADGAGQTAATSNRTFFEFVRMTATGSTTA